jgi:hypothetical protein
MKFLEFWPGETPAGMQEDRLSKRFLVKHPLTSLDLNARVNKNFILNQEKEMKVLALVVALTVSGWTLACSQDGKTGFLPENNMYIPVGTKAVNGGLTQAQFNSVINKVEKIYAPVVANMGGKLVIERLWADGNVNAYAKRETGREWGVEMYGGLARHATVTQDGFALVLCHELGHHIGGAPKKRRVGGTWASSEGQSDYFATLKCLRQVFLNDDNAAVVKKLVAPAFLTAACKKSFSQVDADICIRSAMAGASVAALFASMDHSKGANFNTPDTATVAQSFDGHPATQCRLDTFFQGAICTVGFNEDVSQRDEVQGTCHGSTGHRTGLRPRCWHKPVK